MKITKEMGAACLKAMDPDKELTRREVAAVVDALCAAELDGLAFAHIGTKGEFRTALAMCAAVAGVKPK